MKWRSQMKGGGTTITPKSQLSLEGAMAITLNNTSTHPTGALSLESAMGVTLTPHPLIHETALA